MWIHGSEGPAVVDYVRRDIGAASRATWARAGREIAAGYARAKSPLVALTTLVPPVPALHLYAQPADPAYLSAQRAFALEHPWFEPKRLDARSHFPMLEMPVAVAKEIESFVSARKEPFAR